jgi:hypothetical protein
MHNFFRKTTFSQVFYNSRFEFKLNPSILKYTKSSIKMIGDYKTFVKQAFVQINIILFDYLLRKKIFSTLF